MQQLPGPEEQPQSRLSMQQFPPSHRPEQHSAPKVQVAGGSTQQVLCTQVVEQHSESRTQAAASARQAPQVWSAERQIEAPQQSLAPLQVEASPMQHTPPVQIPVLQQSASSTHSPPGFWQLDGRQAPSRQEYRKQHSSPRGQSSPREEHWQIPPLQASRAQHSLSLAQASRSCPQASCRQTPARQLSPSQQSATTVQASVTLPQLPAATQRPPWQVSLQQSAAEEQGSSSGRHPDSQDLRSQTSPAQQSAVDLQTPPSSGLQEQVAPMHPKEQQSESMLQLSPTSSQPEDGAEGAQRQPPRRNTPNTKAMNLKRSVEGIDDLVTE